MNIYGLDIIFLALFLTFGEIITIHDLIDTKHYGRYFKHLETLDNSEININDFLGINQKEPHKNKDKFILFKINKPVNSISISNGIENTMTYTFDIIVFHYIIKFLYLYIYKLNAYKLPFLIDDNEKEVLICIDSKVSYELIEKKFGLLIFNKMVNDKKIINHFSLSWIQYIHSSLKKLFIIYLSYFFKYKNKCFIMDFKIHNKKIIFQLYDLIKEMEPFGKYYSKPKLYNTMNYCMSYFKGYDYLYQEHKLIECFEIATIENKLTNTIEYHSLINNLIDKNNYLISNFDPKDSYINKFISNHPVIKEKYIINEVFI